MLSISRSAFQHSRLCAVEPPAWWEAWLPLHKMSDQEWEEYQEQKAEAFRQRCVSPLLCEPASCISQASCISIYSSDACAFS